MTWIKIIPPAEAAPDLRAGYEAVYALYPPDYQIEVPAVQNPDGSADSIVAAHSLIPQALRHAMSTFGVLLAPDLPLTRRQHEMIATVVSALNRCVY
jgi:alkylhydroperoxidase family enzyme